MLDRSRSYVNVQTLVQRLSTENLTDESSVPAFERQLASFLGAPLTIATNQARAALLIGLKALGVEKGDEVIVQSFTYKGVIDVIIEVGATPIFVDNSLGNLNANVPEIEKKISPRTKVIMATHLFGIPCEIQEIRDLANRHSCFLIEDCAQCLGSRYGERLAGSIGDLAIVSFNYDKHMTTGEGGVLIVNSPDLIERVRTVAARYQRISHHDDCCYVYGLLVQHCATERDVYAKWITAYFGQDCCKNNPDIFRLVERLVKENATEGEIKKALIPHIHAEVEKLHPPPRLTIPKGFRNLLTQPVVQEAARIGRVIYDRVTVPPFAKIEQPHLLMGSVRGIAGQVALEYLPRINETRNRNTATFLKLLQDYPCFTPPKIPARATPAFLRLNVLNYSAHALPTIMEGAIAHGFELGNFQWAEPVHLTRPYMTRVAHNRKDLARSEFIAHHLINLPIHHYVTPHDIEEIAAFLGTFAETK
jgi:dTDP-4-amino-4,6-dideoxygalactose transaminase